ncbi:MAG: hypothetical protein C0404_13415 [Verrucomicrobia bacterium]|nr:hypothetical protein [Verrucomicrobiota bacterium]
MRKLKVDSLFAGHLHPALCNGSAHVEAVAKCFDNLRVPPSIVWYCCPAMRKHTTIRRFVAEHEVEQLLFDLVAIESHSDVKGEESTLASHIRKLFRQEGIRADLVPVLDGRSNVVATLPGAGKGPVLLLNGHLDTVPPYAMKKPFRPRVFTDRIIGRGTSDMKGAIAAMIGVMLEMKRSGVKMDGTLVFAGTIGEETYSPGAQHLVRSGVKADFAIVGESTEMRPGVAHKGIIRAEAIFTGKAAHSSVPECGINAIHKASRWIRHIETDFIPRLAEQKHPLLGSPTINIGMINGGTRAAIVPDRCSVVIDHRILPGQRRAAMLGNLRRTIQVMARSDADFVAELDELPVFNGVPHGPFESSPNSKLVRSLLGAYREVFGRTTVPCGVPYWTDAAIFAGIPGAQVVVCGPGNIAQAHTNDEYLERSQLSAAFRIYRHAAMDLCTERDG